MPPSPKRLKVERYKVTSETYRVVRGNKLVPDVEADYEHSSDGSEELRILNLTIAASKGEIIGIHYYINPDVRTNPRVALKQGIRRLRRNSNWRTLLDGFPSKASDLLKKALEYIPPRDG